MDLLDFEVMLPIEEGVENSNVDDVDGDLDETVAAGKLNGDDRVSLWRRRLWEGPRFGVEVYGEFPLRCSL